MNRIRLILYTALLLAACLMLSSCRTARYVYVPEHHTRYIVRTDSVVSIDTLTVHDSVSVLIVGDTVRTERYHYRDRLKYRCITNTDTLYKTDSVTITAPMERSLSRYENLSMRVGRAAIGLLAVLAIIAALFGVRWLIGKIKT